MKIAIYSTQIIPTNSDLDQYGGLELEAGLQAKYFDEAGHEVHLFGCKGSWKPPHGHLYVVGEKGTDPVLAWKSYLSNPAIKQVLTDADMVCSHDWGYLPYSIHNELKHLCQVWHGPDPGFIKPPPVPKPNFITVSFNHAKRLMKLAPGTNWRAVQNGIPTYKYTFNSKPLAERERLLFLGRMYLPKGVHRAIEIANMMKMPIDIVGSSFGDVPSYTEQIKKMCEQSQYGAKFHGEVSFAKKLEFYRNAKCVILPIIEYGMTDAQGKPWIWCIHPEQYVDTLIPKPIKDVKKGEKILSHDGRYNLVDSIFSKEYKGKLFKIKVCTLSKEIIVSPEHKLFSLKPEKCIVQGTSIQTCTPNYTACSCKKRKNFYNESRIEKYKKARELQKAGASYIKISKEIGISKTTVYYWLFKNRPPKINLKPPYLSYKGEWIEAKNLTTEHYVGFPIPIEESNSIEEVHMPLSLLELFGYYVAEGYTNGCSMRLCFGLHEKELIKRATDIIKKELGLNTSFRARKTGSELIFHNKKLCKYFDEWFGKGAKNKKIPEWLMLSTIDNLKSFLKGLWLGDGCLVKTSIKEGTYKHLEFTTSSKQLAYQLKIILLKLGIVCYVRERIQGKKAFGAGNEVFNVIVRGDSDKLAKIIGKDASCHRKGRWKTQGFIKDNILWMPIRKISEEEYTGLIYDLHVINSNSYTCQGIAVHNSEPFGLVTSEAGACGTPTIVTPNGGWNESMMHGFNGYFANTNEEFCYYLKRINEIKPENCRWAAERFDYKIMGENYLKLFKEIIESGGW